VLRPGVEDYRRSSETPLYESDVFAQLSSQERQAVEALVARLAARGIGNVMIVAARPFLSPTKTAPLTRTQASTSKKEIPYTSLSPTKPLPAPNTSPSPTSLRAALGIPHFINAIIDNLLGQPQVVIPTVAGDLAPAAGEAAVNYNVDLTDAAAFCGEVWKSVSGWRRDNGRAYDGSCSEWAKRAREYLKVRAQLHPELEITDIRLVIMGRDSYGGVRHVWVEFKMQGSWYLADGTISQLMRSRMISRALFLLSEGNLSVTAPCFSAGQKI